MILAGAGQLFRGLGRGVCAVDFFGTDFDVIGQLSDQFRGQVYDVFVFESLKPKIPKQVFGENFVVDGLSTLGRLLSDCIQGVCQSLHFLSLSFSFVT